MLDLKWTRAMAVEVEELDEDHRIAIANMSDLRSRLALRQSGPTLRVFDDLLRTCRLHFAREERMLAECGFPMLAYHVKGHRHAEAELLVLRDRLERRDWRGAESALEACCETFLFRLILDDLDYKLFLHDKQLLPRFSGIGIAEWLPRAPGPSVPAEAEPKSR
jgi:hemerythrin